MATPRRSVRIRPEVMAVLVLRAPRGTGEGEMAGWHAGEDGASTTGGVLVGDVCQSPPLLGLVLPDEPARGARL
eukprot:scaffold76420_cov39-Phaeocystis_antarctica.AAC.1